MNEENEWGELESKVMTIDNHIPFLFVIIVLALAMSQSLALSSLDPMDKEFLTSNILFFLFTSHGLILFWSSNLHV